ncbi:MAG TPA: AMP-binding protein [Acidimicrobiia bacterium]|jgi:malonyl-CoA/methylmalonyl-CoA synthetase
MKAWEVHLPPGVPAPAAERRLLESGTLPAAWAARFAAAPERPVLWSAEAGWVTAGTLDAASRRVAARFHRAGLGPGDRVFMSAAASAAYVAAHLGALRLGLVVVPANTAYREREVAHLVTDAGPAAAVVDDAGRAAWVRRAAGGDVVVVGPEVDLPEGTGAGLDLDLDAAAPSDPALLGYTSGTTGAPKGALLSHANLLATSEAVRLAWRWSPDDRLVLALPLFHMHGLGVGLHGTLLAGASVVLLPRFETGAVLDAARDHEATLFFGVPTMYSRLAAAPRLGELARLRLCVSGSAPLPPAVFERVAAGCGHEPLERYGMTETGMNVSNPHDGERRPGTVGFPLPGVQLRLAGGPTPGEILLRGPNVFSGYWRNRAATDEAFTDGWFRTGDIGELDADSYLRIVGRKKELIITGGLNVYPREVEDVLLTHPGVAEVAVAGVADAEWGEVVTAWVVPTGEPPGERELLAHAAQGLAGFKCPRSVRFVESLPRNALGKLLRHQLGN